MGVAGASHLGLPVPSALQQLRNGCDDLSASDGAGELVGTMLVVRASQRATIEQVCAHHWLAPREGERPLELNGSAATPVWDEQVGARLEAMGCPLALVQHHVNAGASNHVTAAYECLLHADPAAAAPQHQQGGA